RECRAPRRQDRGRRDNYRQGSKVEEQVPKALMAINEVGWDWSYMANDEENHALVVEKEALTEFALMANTSAENSKLTGFQTASKDLDSLLENQILDKNKEGLGYSDVPPPPAQIYSSPKKDMSWTGLLEFKDDTITDYSRHAPTIESSLNNAQNRNPSVTEEASPGSSQNNFDDKGYWDSGCSRHMTGNISYLSDFEPFDGGSVCFGQGRCKITSKGSIKTGKLEFENNVLFTDSECIVLGKNFKLSDDDNVLLRTPRQHNMYSIDLNNIVPHKDLTCLVAKASADDKPQDDCSTDVPKSSGNFNPTTTLTNSSADQLETLTVETPIPTVSSPVPTSCFTDSLEPSSDTRLISKRVANQVETSSLDNILTLTNRFKDILGVTTKSTDSDGVEADVSNMETTITASPTPTLRIHKDHPKIYQMDVKSACLYDTIDEEVYVMQPPRFQDPEFPAKVYKVEKAMGTIDQTLFIRRQRGDFILVQVYTNDIISGSSNPQLCRGFEALMHEKFQMSDMGKLNFFLGLQVLQREDGIFLSQDKYVGDIFKNLDIQMLDHQILLWTRRILEEKTELEKISSNTPMDKENPWGKDTTGKDVDLHLYRSMIGSLMYLTASRPNIMFAVCACARHQVTPKECHLHAVKRIFRYLKGHPKLGLWYPKESLFDLVAYSDSDYGGATQDRKSTTEGCQFFSKRLISRQCKKQTIMATSTTEDRKSTTGGCQFLGRTLISWQCQKQIIVATSTTKAEYVAAASCCGEVL
nr:hypothetical protein [Tanacetum cinerariifolium]